MSKQLYVKKTKAEITAMREGGKIHTEVLNTLAAKAKPGIATIELDEIAERAIKKHKATATFKGHRGGAKTPFPCSICTCVNDEIVHGIPSKRVLQDGDLLKLDMGITHKGTIVDAGCTVIIGNASAEARRLAKVTQQSLNAAAQIIAPGIMINQIGSVVQHIVERAGFTVVRKLVGHGVGRQLWEPPEIPNYYRAKDVIRLEKNMTIAIEPMVNAGSAAIRDCADGWTIATVDGSLSAYAEYTILVTDRGGEILTKHD